jgi:hypothetical protein
MANLYYVKAFEMMRAKVDGMERSGMETISVSSLQEMFNEISSEAYNQQKASGEEMAEIFSDFVNIMGTSHKQEFAAKLLTKHRTLQQESFDTFVECIKLWSKLPENLYDPRNKWAVEKSKEIIEKVEL